MDHDNTAEVSQSRRTALKALAAATGAVTLASLPTRWRKPTVQVGAIPAHAQGSCVAILIEVEFESASDWVTDFIGGGPPTTISSGSTAESFYWPCGSGCVWFTITAYNEITVNLTIFGETDTRVGGGGNTLYVAVNLDTQVSRVDNTDFAISDIGCAVD